MSKNNNNISKKNFTFVQQDKKIHDLKFDSKPTTYFKDAWRRFLKNKSSVAGGVIIGVLIILAIFVPIFNDNVITGDRSALKFLPPKVPGFENSNTLNGRRYVENIILNDFYPDEEDYHPAGYYRRAVVGDMEPRVDLINSHGRYVRGGKISLRADSLANTARFETNTIIGVNLTNDFIYEIDVDQDLNAVHKYELYALVYYNGAGADPTRVVLKPSSNSYGVTTLTDFSTTLLDSRPLEIVTSTFSMKLGLSIEASTTDEASRIIFSRLEVLPSDEEVTNPFLHHNFTEGNELLLRSSDDYGLRYELTSEAVLPYRYSFIGVRALYQGEVTRVNFTYDFYEEVFGEVERRVEITTLRRFRDQGLITFDDSDGEIETIIATFQVLSDKSPVREIISGTKEVVVLPGKTTVIYDFVAKVSLYREKGYDSIPYYLFGTNERGHDFFKVVFNGLRTSLMLGFGAAAINIIIGLIWGSISGYYGGNIDLAMERFTDILGGIPWIIVMTLTILHLGNNFGVFLLSLILTGWIGTSSITRSQFYRYKRREYVLASRTLGAKDGRLIFKHILPNAIGPIVTSAVMMIPGVIFSEATISYLGLGLQGLTSFGVALSEAQSSISTNPYLITSASVIIAFLMISFNLFGNGLRDAFNPSLKGVE